MDECFTFIPLSFESDFLVCKSEMGMQFLTNHLNESWLGTELGFSFFFRRSEIVKSLKLSSLS